MKRKQPISAKSQFYKKKKELPSAVDDLATHEEKDIKQIQPQQRTNPINVQLQQSSDEDEDVDTGARNNPDEQSRFVLGLMQKNRINEKNSFDVPLINIRELTAFNQTEDGDAWKTISATLDAGSKIYGFRVDLVHQNTYKVLGGLHRTQVNPNGRAANEEQKELEQEQMRKRKLANTGGENTLEKNPAALDTNKYDLEFEIDPLFQQTSAKFDEAGAKGLLMNNLTINENLMLALDSEVLPIKPQYGQINIDEYKNKLREVANLKLCPELTQFREEIHQRSKNIMNLNSSVINPYPMNMEYGYEEPHFENEDHMDDASQNSEVQPQMLPQSPQQPMVMNHRFNLHNFEQAVSHIGTGKVFDNDKEHLAWMKLDMNNSLLIKKKVVTKNNKTKKLVRKHGLPFSFDEADEKEEEISREILQVKEKENYITKPDYSQFGQFHLLPRSYQIDKAELYQPFQISHLPEWSQENPEQGDEFAAADVGGMEEGAQMQGFTQGSAPRANNRLNIPIKELKQKVWENLEKVIPPTSAKFGLEFNQVHSQLPFMLNLGDCRGKVSIQTSFVAMLHLANEEGLRFQQGQNEDDFMIYKES